jgi:hypothetical protein
MKLCAAVEANMAATRLSASHYIYHTQIMLELDFGIKASPLKLAKLGCGK